MEPSTNSELGRAVDMSRRMHQISEEAFLMRMQATNAIVMTRSRGISVPGFEAVSEQMNQVSRDLGAQLAGLRECMTGWIRAVSAKVGLMREIAMFDEALVAAPHASRAISSIIAPLRDRLRANQETERERKKLERALNEVKATAATGCVLARTAKIEAAYGDALADVLAETAEAFTRLADSVDESVRTLAHWITRK